LLEEIIKFFAMAVQSLFVTRSWKLVRMIHFEQLFQWCTHHLRYDFT